MPYYLVFLGSARDGTPPVSACAWPAACVQLLEADGASVELIDPLEIELGAVFKPHFAYAQAKVPKVLESLADKIEAADGYVMVSPSTTIP